MYASPSIVPYKTTLQLVYNSKKDPYILCTFILIVLNLLLLRILNLLFLASLYFIYLKEMPVCKKILIGLILCLFIATNTVVLAQSKPDLVVKELLRKASDNIHSNPNKAFSYLSEALKYKDDITETQLLLLYQVAATAYFNQQSYLSALDYFYESLELQKKLDPSKLHFIYNNIGCVYMELGDPVKSRKFLNQSLAGLKQAIARGKLGEKNAEAYLVYGNLAVLEIDAKNYAKALEMLYIHKNHSLRLKDTVGTIKAYQNLASVYDKLNKQDSCNFYSNKGIFLSKKGNFAEELADMYYQRGNIYNTRKNDSAGYYLQTAFNFAEKFAMTDIKQLSSKDLADLYGSRKDYEKSNFYLRLANQLSEENLKQQNKKKIELLEFENAQKIKEQEAAVKTQKTENILIFSFILLVPVSVIVFLMYRLQRTKANKRKVENELLVQKMEGKNKVLTSNAIQMLQASGIIDSTQKELNHLKTITDTPTNKMLSQIISDLKTGNQSFNKKEFEKIFIETDEEFYRKLIKEYPLLTKNEIRLCAFAKMNFSTKEISAITQQSSNSILVARSRLRKKIGIGENQNLTIFFKSF